MEEAHHLCDEVAIMDHGKIIAQGRPHELISRHGGGIQILLPLDSCMDQIAGLPFQMTTSENTLHIRVEEMNQAVQTLIEAGLDLNHMDVRMPSLEQVFLNLTGHHLRE
jgi:ABC-2 type transport system ATP-binding protein